MFSLKLHISLEVSLKTEAHTKVYSACVSPLLLDPESLTSSSGDM